MARAEQTLQHVHSVSPSVLRHGGTLLPLRLLAHGEASSGTRRGARYPPPLLRLFTSKWSRLLVLAARVNGATKQCELLRNYRLARDEKKLSNTSRSYTPQGRKGPSEEVLPSLRRSSPSAMQHRTAFESEFLVVAGRKTWPEVIRSGTYILFTCL